MVTGHVHIIAHQVPFPVDTDSSNDTFFAIKAFTEAGINVHLHCYDYGKGKQPELEQSCHQVYYYSRNTGHKGIGWSLPYIIGSRANPELIDRLNKDDHPVLFMGLHATYPLLTKVFRKQRKILVRFNRLESVYYGELAKITPWGIRKIYYSIESMLCQFAENRICRFYPIAAASRELTETIKRKQTKNPVVLINQFRGLPLVYFESGKGGFCLFHGNLSERENEYAAHWLLEHVFNKIEIPFVIAGERPSTTLEQAAHLRMHTCLVANPGEKEMMDLIKKAQVNLMPSFTSAGNRLGVLKSLALGRHVLVNPKGAQHNRLSEICEVATDPDAFCEAINILFEKEFKEEQKNEREGFLNREFHDTESLNQMIKMLY